MPLMTTQHTILPVIITPDGEPAATDEDVAALRSVRLEIIDWRAAYGHGVLILDPALQASPLPLSAFAQDPHQVGAKFCFDHYPMVDNPDLTILFAIKGIDSRIIGDSMGTVQTYGLASLQYALIAWDMIEGAQFSPEGDGHRLLCAIVAHELGHAVQGWQHDNVTPNNIMGRWWEWPGVGMPSPQQGSFRVLSVGVTPSTGACPAPPSGPEDSHE